MCKSIFCCLECRNRHETTTHNPNDVRSERNRMRCGLCQGYTTMEFQCRNDFALIMHLSQVHLPLHCKKCLTVSGFSSFFFFIVVVMSLCTAISCSMSHTLMENLLLVFLIRSNSIRSLIFLQPINVRI